MTHASASGPVRALVVDDEPLARGYLRSLLAEQGDVEVVGEAEDGRAAAKAIRTLSPELVFLDIQMPSLDGFGLVEAIREMHQPTPYIIFVTAYDQYALRAFEVQALDYLLKPFDGERLGRAVRRAVSFIRRPGSSEEPRDENDRILTLLEELRRRAQRTYATRLPVKDDGRIRFLDVERIDWIEAAEKVSRLHSGKEVHVLRESLSALEAQLDPARFLRIHRSTIVNLSRIRELQPWFQGDFVVLLADGTRLTSGRTYRERLRTLAREGTRG